MAMDAGATGGHLKAFVVPNLGTPKYFLSTCSIPGIV